MLGLYGNATLKSFTTSKLLLNIFPSIIFVNSLISAKFKIFGNIDSKRVIITFSFYVIHQQHTAVLISRNIGYTRTI